MPRNRYQERAKQVFRAVLRHVKDPELRADMQGGLDDMNRADVLWNQWSLDAQMIGVRNPAFEGESIGYPEDDFEDDDEEDKDDQARKKPR